MSDESGKTEQKDCTGCLFRAWYHRKRICGIFEMNAPVVNGTCIRYVDETHPEGPMGVRY